ncbi:PAS domain-containing protein [Longimicrobium sp.]|uniref:PAS domain-containing protein n=1 Tax=Longimicrobium sp. TaxID=2029185 RepID=UPI003B3B8444
MDEAGTWPAGGGETGALVRATDWSRTPLGPVGEWPPALRTVVQTVLDLPFPAVVLWGPELVQVYNDGYRELMGRKHPAGLGQPTRACWPEVWHINESIYRRVWAGESLSLQDALYPITRSGTLEDAWFTLSYSPLRDGAGAVAGVLVTVAETTARVLEARERERAEAARRASETRYRALATASADVIYRMSPDWSEMRQLDGRGFLSDTAQPSGSWLERYIHPDDRARVTAAIERAVREKTVFELEHRVLRADGTLGWTFSRAVPLLDEAGEVAEWVGAASDVTGRKDAEAALRESEARASALVTVLPGSAVFIVDPAMRYRLAEGEALRDAGLSGEQFVGRTPEEVLGPGFAAEYAANYRRALAGQPFEAEHAVRGRTFLTRGTPLRDSAGDVTAALIVAVDVTAQQAARAALRESEAKYRTLFDAIDEGLAISEMVYDDGGEIVDMIYRQVNRAFERHGGVHDVVGRSIFQVIPGVEDHWLDIYRRVAKTGEPERVQNHQRDVDRWFDVYFSRIGANGRFVATVFNDITEQKRAETDLRESQARHAFLLTLSDALRAAPDEASVKEQAVRRLAEHLRLDRCWISEVFEQQGTSTVGPEHRRPDLPPMSGVVRLSDYGETMRQLATQPMVVGDAPGDPRFSPSEKELLAGLHLRALLVAPLRKGENHVVWALAATMATPRDWTDGERVLLEEVAERTWSAIERARAEAALRESQERQAFLLKLSDALRPLADPRAAMAAACRLLGEVVDADRTNYAEVEGEEYVVAREHRRAGLASMAGRYPITSFRPAERTAFEAGHTVAVADIQADPAIPPEQAAAYAALGVRAFVSVPLVKQGGLVAVLSVIRSRPGAFTPAQVALIEETADRTWAAVEWSRTEALRRHAEELNVFLVRFSDAVRGLADPRAVAQAACRLVAERLGVERVDWAEVDWAAREYVVGASVHVPGVPVIEGRFPVDAWEPFTSLHVAGRPVVVNDTQADERIPPPMKEGYVQIEVGADLAVPVVAGGRLRCTLAANQRLPRRWTEAEVELVQGIAGRCWSEVERARAEAALRESEERYRTLFETMTQGYALNELVRDARGRVVDVRLLELNPAFERLLGVPVAAARGRTAREVVPLMEDWWFETSERTVRTGEPVRMEQELAALGKWYEVSLYPGAGDRFSVLYDDITARKAAELALRESEAKYSAAFDAMDEGFCIMELVRDARGEVVDLAFREANRAFPRHIGAADVAGRTAGELLPALQSSWIETYTRVARTGRAERAENYLRGVDRWFSVYFSRVGGEDSRYVAVLVSDITERRRAEVALRASEARQAFLVRLGDALRPLDDAAAIQGAAARLLGQHLGADRASYAEVEGEPGAEMGTLRGQYVREGGAAGPAPEPFPARYAYAQFGEHAVTSRRRGEVLVVADVDADPTFDPVARAAWAAGGVRAAVVVPLVKAGRFVAELGVQAQSARAWTPEEVSLVAEVAERTWAAVERARAEAALRESEERQAFLLELSDALRVEPDKDAVADRSIRMLIEHMRLDRSYIVSYRPEDDRAWLVHQRGNDTVPPLPDVFILSDYPAAFRAVFDQTFVVEDELKRQGLSEAERRNSGRLGMRAMVAATLPKGEGTPLWSMVAVSSRPRRWTRGEIALIEEATERTWTAMERARAETALRESEARAMALVATLPRSAAFIVDHELRYRLAEGEALRDAGFTPGQFVGRTVEEVLGPAMAADYAPGYRQVLGGGTFEAEHDAHGRTFLTRGTPLRDAAGRVTAALFISVDVTARKAAEAALRESEGKYRTLFETMGQGYCELELVRDPAGRAVDQRYLNFNFAFERIFGIPVAQAKGRLASEVFPGLEPWWHQAFDRAARSGAPERLEHEMVSLGRWFEVQVYPRGGDRLMVLFDDITARKTAETALRELNEALERRVEARTAELVRADQARRQVLRQLVTAGENERRRVSRELHDSLGQLVTGLLLGLKALPRAADGEQARIEDLERLADRIAREMQHMAVQLRPPALDNLGLRLALQAHLEEWSHRYGIECDFHAVGLDGERFAAEVETTLYRVVQEGLNNVVKHAGATRASLVLERRQGMVGAILEDDGRGFEVEATLASPEKSRRLGLRGMRERVALVGGELEIESAEGAGTTLYVRIPLPAEGEEEGHGDGTTES